MFPLSTSKHLRAGPGFISWIVLITALLCGVGCREEPAVVVQTRPRTADPVKPFDLNTYQSGLEHILAAVVIRDEESSEATKPQAAKVPAQRFAWFFKLSAPAAEAKSFRDPFERWIASLEFTRDEDQGSIVPRWENPPGWFDSRGEPGQYATVRIPAEPVPLSLTITRLPVTGKNESKYLASNVNRWLGQLGQVAVDQATVDSLTLTKGTKSGEATFVELVGYFERTPPWRTPGAAAARRIAGSTKPRSAEQQPTNQEPSKPTASKAGELSYDTPAGWEPGRMNSMRKVALQKKRGDGEEVTAQAEITVTTFPATAGMKDPLGNARRWAGEADIAADEQGLLDMYTDLDIGGVDSKFIRLVAEDNSDARRAVIAAMTERQGTMWFFKLSGEKSAVAASEADFNEFLDSFQYPASP